MRIRTALLATALAALSGCAGCDSVPDDALEDCQASQVVSGAVKTDILFVIDDSGSMAGEQEAVRAALGRFVQTLASSPIGNDFQIGVTNTSVEEYLNANGSQPSDFREYGSGPSTGVPYPAGALVAVDPTNLVSGNASTYGDYYYGTPDPGFSGSTILTWDAANLTTAFRNNVLVGTVGASREQPLRAAQLALSTELEAGGENVGFMRPGARLAIIFVTDEDDWSGPADATITSDTLAQGNRDDAASSKLLQVSDFVAFLQGPIAGERRDVVVAAIAGVTCTGGVCTNTLCSGAQRRPDRILQVLDALPAAKTRLASICDTSFDQALDDFAVAMMSQTLPLDGAVADYRMLTARVTREGSSIACSIAHVDASAAERNAADAVYEPPLAGRPASLTFQNDCALEPGDAVSVGVVCVR
jgi:hypothetical protein